MGVLALLAGPADAALASTVTVTTTADQFGTGPECSLREAIQAANTDAAFGGCPSGGGSDTITLAAGVYELTISGRLEDVTATGDLDLMGNVTISGAVAATTFVQAGADTTGRI